MNVIRNTMLVCALVCASFTAYAAEGDKPGRGEKTAVDTLPDAVKATFAKEAPDAKEVYKVNKDGKDSYRVRVKGADGKSIMLVVGTDGAVVSKEPAKERPAK
jgi:hypothetical protein